MAARGFMSAASWKNVRSAARVRVECVSGERPIDILRSNHPFYHGGRQSGSRSRRADRLCDIRGVTCAELDGQDP